MALGGVVMCAKKMSVANFNVVFYEDGGEEKPLLDYFDSIVMPALLNEYKRKTDGATYTFKDIKLKEYDDNEFVLTGLIIKKTVLEVKSNLDDAGNLIFLDDKYPTAPFSMFAIYLKNHRMVFVENQKGSPTLKNFSALVKGAIGAYMRLQDKILKEKGEKPLPIPVINIVGVPVRGNIEKELKDVKKIKQLTLRFYPLNGDIDFSGMFGNMAKELRQQVDSKNGEIVLKSPKNTEGVVELLDKSYGTVEPILKVEYPDKTEKTIKNDVLTERVLVDIDDTNMNEGVDQMVNRGAKLNNINYVSSDNEKTYEANVDSLRKYV